MANKEALWKYNLYAGDDNYGSSNGNYRLNRNHEYFLCSLSRLELVWIIKSHVLLGKEELKVRICQHNIC